MAISYMLQSVFYYHVALKPIFVVIKFFTFFQQCGFLPYRAGINKEPCANHGLSRNCK